MIRKGSLVRYIGKGGGVPTGKLLFVHDVNGDKVVFWWMTTKWTKRSLPLSEVEEVVE